MVTREREDAPSKMLLLMRRSVGTQCHSTHLYQLNCIKMARPTVSCPPKNTSASFLVRSPLARGRSLVRAEKGELSVKNYVETGLTSSPTDLSKFLSHMSLIVQPAPLITSAPIPHRLIYVKGTLGGRCRAYEAMAIDHAGVRVVQNVSKCVSE
jgi:hypothetical protein